jgi:hypothetical protein
MAMHKGGARLRWRGAETVREILRRVNRGEQALVLLPLGLHHALCVRVGVDERAHGLSDATLDAERFERLTHIKGLRELEQLRGLVERASMNVRVRTPPPQLLFSAQDTGRRHARPQHHWNRTATLAT